MSRRLNIDKILIKRGTGAQNDAYTGMNGELTIDTDTHTLRVHDGVTAGGFKTKFDGDYNSLTNKPAIPADVSELTDTNGLLTQFSGDYADLTNTPAIPADVSDLTDTSGLLTPADLTGYATETYVDAVVGNIVIPADVSELTDTTNLLVHFSGDYADLTNKPALFSGDYADLTNKPALFSGSYNDLTDTPTASTYSDTDVATYLNGNINTHLIPDTNVAYDLGTAEKKFRDLYLSSATIHMGDQTISVSETGISFNGNALESTLDYNNLNNKPTLITSYNDLADKPVIPDYGDHASAGYVTGTNVTNMVTLTQAEYDAIGTPSATTVYIIVGD